MGLARAGASAASARRRAASNLAAPLGKETAEKGHCVETITWFGFAEPARTPQDIVGRLNGEIVQLLALPDMRRQFASQGIEVIGGTPEQFTAYIAEEIMKWARVIKVSCARAE